MKSITRVAVLTAAMAVAPTIPDKGLAEAMSEPEHERALEPRK